MLQLREGSIGGRLGCLDPVAADMFLQAYGRPVVDYSGAQQGRMQLFAIVDRTCCRGN